MSTFMCVFYLSEHTFWNIILEFVQKSISTNTNKYIREIIWITWIILERYEDTRGEHANFWNLFTIMISTQLGTKTKLFWFCAKKFWREHEINIHNSLSVWSIIHPCTSGIFRISNNAHAGVYSNLFTLENVRLVAIGQFLLQIINFIKWKYSM